MHLMDTSPSLIMVLCGVVGVFFPIKICNQYSTGFNLRDFAGHQWFNTVISDTGKLPSWTLIFYCPDDS